MKPQSNRILVRSVVGLSVLTACAFPALLMLHKSTRANASPGLVYSRDGYGGFVEARPQATPKPAPSGDALQQVSATYNAGRYTDAAAQADVALRNLQGQPNPDMVRKQTEILIISGYSLARNRDYAGAKQRFDSAWNKASELPDHGARKANLGDKQPSAEEEAAYESAVCTSAQGDKKTAEAELKQFIQHYPQSVLIHGAIGRIARMHGGDVPADAEKTWKAAMEMQRANQLAREREEALCGPECLAEILRRKGDHADGHRLADEMHTDADGTSMLAIAETAKKHGMNAQGYRLTMETLASQKLPVLAMLPDHFVIVDAVSPAGVTIWDPALLHRNQAPVRQISMAEWQKLWHGAVLAL